MVGPKEIVIYLTHLLAVHFNMFDIQLIFSNELLVFFIQLADLRHAQLSPSIPDPHVFVLDYKLRDYGSVIPQSISTPATFGRFNGLSKMPIFFVLADRKTLGLQLRQAVAGNFTGLLNEHGPIPKVTSICVGVSVSQVTHHGAIVRILYTSSGQAMGNRRVTFGLGNKSKHWQQASQVWYALV